MANGGMWPMRQSDRGGLLVSAIKDVPEGAAALGAAASMRSAIEHDAAEALKRAEAKIARAEPGTCVELDKDEVAAVVGEPDTAAEARPSALERAIAKHRACKPGQVLEMDAEEWAAFFPWVNKTDESAAKNGARAADARVRDRTLEQLTEGRKDDKDKARWDLLPAEPLEEIAEVLTYGAAKYSERNWERGMRWGRCYAALMRHLWAWWWGEDKDPETGMSHLAHAGCCLFFLMAYRRRGIGVDDRKVLP